MNANNHNGLHKNAFALARQGSALTDFFTGRWASFHGLFVTRIVGDARGQRQGFFHVGDHLGQGLWP